jgi:ligand-binding SRPBCC domain-containing protein
LSLSIDLHVASAHQTGEGVIAGVTHGLIGLGETVTWQGRHFGLTLTPKYERPRYFQDVMLNCAFRTFTHDHYFDLSTDGGTIMLDKLQFTAPLGPLGWIAERLVLRRYLTRFLVARNATIKRIAEGPEDAWAPFLRGA